MVFSLFVFLTLIIVIEALKSKDISAIKKKKKAHHKATSIIGSLAHIGNNIICDIPCSELELLPPLRLYTLSLKKSTHTHTHTHTHIYK